MDLTHKSEIKILRERELRTRLQMGNKMEGNRGRELESLDGREELGSLPAGT